LQQGRFVGDVCYYYGDQAPNFVRPKHIDPSLGKGFDYDVANSEVILSRMNVKNGKIVLPDGMTYELLVLPDRQDANPQVLEKIMSLVRDGATVVGPKLTRSNGLTDYPRLDDKVKLLAGELWGTCNGKEIKEITYGKGKVIWGKELKQILEERGIGPDFIFSGRDDSTDLDFIHRSTGNEEIYFVSNKKLQWAQAECSFRVKNKIPELWIPETGDIRKDLIYESSGQMTKVFLQLPPAGSVFVVFRENSVRRNVVSDSTVISTVSNLPSPLVLSGPWDITFPEELGAPANAVFPALISWTSSKVDGIKYFSGIATYRKEFEIPGDMLTSDNLLYLDLGEVKMIADVYLNNNHLGILWKPPFRVDITKSIRPGKNSLEIEVANDWSNRIVGDQKLPEEKRITSTNITSPTTSDLLWKDAPLLESGLLGPVKVIAAKKNHLDYQSNK
jgi:hypothetical protein